MKRMNKKGQESTTGGAVVGWLLILALLALGAWIIFFGGWATLVKIFNFSTVSDLGSVQQGCQTAASTNDPSFCSALKSVTLGGVTQYVTCSYLASIKQLPTLSNGGVSCSPNAVADLQGNCKNLNKKNIQVNSATVNIGDTSNDCTKLTSTY